MDAKRPTTASDRCAACEKAPIHPDKKCCFNCDRADTNCGVWHTCGKDCPGWDPKAPEPVGSDFEVPAKIKTPFAKVIVDDGNNASYYNICYYDPSDGQFHIGYGSSNPEFVFGWLDEFFEIDDTPVKFVPVVQGRWESLGPHSGHRCNVCKDYYTDDANSLFWCPRCGAEMTEIEKYDYRRRGLPIGAPWTKNVCKHGRRPVDGQTD